MFVCFFTQEMVLFEALFVLTVHIQYSDVGKLLLLLALMHVLSSVSFQRWFDFSAINEDGGSERIIEQEREHQVLERLHAVRMLLHSSFVRVLLKITFIKIIILL